MYIHWMHYGLNITVVAKTYLNYGPILILSQIQRNIPKENNIKILYVHIREPACIINPIIYIKPYGHVVICSNMDIIPKLDGCLLMCRGIEASIFTPIGMVEATTMRRAFS